MSLLLALSTSSAMLSVALIQDGIVLVEQSRQETSHSKSLMPIIDELLNSFSVKACDIDIFVADTGPGSFTGVRIGICAANGLAMAVGKPVMGVSSLLALRYYHLNISPICVMIDARNSNVYAAMYGDNGDVLLEPCAMSAVECAQKIPDNSIMCVGDGAFAYADILREKSDSIQVLGDQQSVECFPQAGCVGLAAWDVFTRTGEFNVQIEPTYLKLSQAEMNLKRS